MRSRTARAVAARLWPSPDPIDFARREAIAGLSASDRALTNAVDLHESAIPIVFDDLSRIWIHPTRVEVLLTLGLAALRDAARHLERALDLLAGIRSENSLRFYDARVLDRRNRKAVE